MNRRYDNNDRQQRNRRDDYNRPSQNSESSRQAQTNYNVPLENIQFNYADIQVGLAEKNNILASPIVFEEECKDFENMNDIKENLLRGIFSFGYNAPSDIQSLAIPQIIAGKNILAQSQSGTGKTGAFIISALQNIDETKSYPQCIILSPTTELAQQTLIVGKSISEHMPTINFSYTVGGTNRTENLNEISGGKDGKNSSQIIIATPGRLLDLITSNLSYFSHVKCLIIDECDELMSGTFQADISRIIHQLPEDKQICLFSATLTTDIIKIADYIIPNHIKILIKKENVTLDGITQTYVEIKHVDDKIGVLIDMLGSMQIQQLIIYVNCKKTAEYIKEKLHQQDFEVLTINSSNSKFERAEIIREFKKGEIKCLISTDLLSRGIDIQQLSLVINYDMPKQDNIQCYVHRIGRSGRFGKKGLSINLVTEREKQIQTLIEMTFNCKIIPLTKDFQKYL